MLVGSSGWTAGDLPNVWPKFGQESWPQLSHNVHPVRWTTDTPHVWPHRRQLQTDARQNAFQLFQKVRSVEVWRALA
jgi:hypothetical protein